MMFDKMCQIKTIKFERIVYIFLIVFGLTAR